MKDNLKVTNGCIISSNGWGQVNVQQIILIELSLCKSGSEIFCDDFVKESRKTTTQD